MRYESVIGLEVHVQLRTATKIFCRCAHRFGAEPNSLVCEVCMGYPGALPVLNQEAVEQGIRLALALGATVRQRSVFARKSYFYADSPKGYQISQYDKPLAENGELPLEHHPLVARIERLHLEEDAGKLLHEAPGGVRLADTSLVDFNRCGTPLLEIVSKPDLRTPSQAQDYLRSLHRVLQYTGTSDGNLEEGSLRCDANISIRPEGATALGVRTEIKNLNSFRHVGKALEYEIQRQALLVGSGGSVVQQTLTWDPHAAKTRPLRGKEEAQDYRYFPDPDLPEVVIGRERLEGLAEETPQMPWQRREYFQRELGLNPEDARVVTQSRQVADYFEALAGQLGGKGSSAAKWVQNDLMRELHDRQEVINSAPPPERAAELLTLIEEGVVSASAAKRVLAEMWTRRVNPLHIAEELELVQVKDTRAIDDWADEVLVAHRSQVESYLGGKHQILGFLVGKVMQASKGQADPKAVKERLEAALARWATGSGS